MKSLDKNIFISKNFKSFLPMICCCFCCSANNLIFIKLIPMMLFLFYYKYFNNLISMTNKKDKRIQKIRIRNLRKNLFISFTSSILLTKSLLLAQKQKNCILTRIFARIFRYNLKLIELQAKNEKN